MVVLASLLIVEFRGGHCQSPGWLSSSCPRPGKDRSHFLTSLRTKSHLGEAGGVGEDLFELHAMSDTRAISAVGFRAVPLKNNYSESLELASLLVKIDIFPSKVRLGHAWEGDHATGLRSKGPACCCPLSCSALPAALNAVKLSICLA